MQTLVETLFGRLIHISIATLLLSVAAGAAIWLLRIRDANLQHRIWTAVLVGILAMPILVIAMPGIPLPQWTRLGASSARATKLPDDGAADSWVADGRPPSPLDGRTNTRLLPSNSAETAADSLRGASHDRQSDADSHDQIASPQPLTFKGNATRAATDRPEIKFASRWPMILASVYFLVALVLLAELLVGLILLQKMVARAKAVDSELPSRGRLAGSGRRSPRIVESDEVLVPGTVGFVRPVVLLPFRWREWSEAKLQAVLAHELAHVRRADWLLTTLAELNRALYWFHPVAWLVRRRLADLAESNCDDAVIVADGNRTRYATYLLEVAASMSVGAANGRASRYGVAMARRPAVGSRIEAILDSNRPLARRLGAGRIIGLLAVGIPAILLAAALRPAADDSKPASPTAKDLRPATGPDKMPTMAAKKATGNAAAPKRAAKRKIVHEHVRGRVLSPSGQQMAGATVFVAWSEVEQELQTDLHEDKLIAQTHSDERGSFDLSFSAEQPFLSRGWYVAATAPGFGPAWIMTNSLFQLGVKAKLPLSSIIESEAKAKLALTLRLTPDQPIHGRIVDLQGVPLAGVRVWIDSVYRPESKQALLDWIQEAKTKRLPRSAQEYSNFTMARQPQKTSPFAGKFPANWDDGLLSHRSPALPPDTVTDADGRFQLTGLGADRLAIVTIESPVITKLFVHVLTRKMPTIAAEPYEFYGLHTWKHYGCDFEFAAEPTQPIVGTVSDADSHRPLADVKVYLQYYAGTYGGQEDFLTTRTDSQGHYKLIGAPGGGGHEVAVTFSTDQSYFPTEKKIRKSSGFEPIQCDFALHRGQWIVGKVTDGESGAPIANAAVEYLPLRNNKFASDYPNYDPIITGSIPRERYRTSGDGTFRVLAIPGPGIVAAIDASRHNRALDHPFVSLTINSVPKRLVGKNGDLKTYLPCTVTNFNALRELDFPKSDRPTTANLQFTRGSSRSVKLVDSDGKPVKGARVLGRMFPPDLYDPLEGSTVEVVGLVPNGVRDFVAIQFDRRIGIATEFVPGGPLTLKLLPCAVARGRMVDRDGKPLAGFRLHVGYDRPDNWRRELIDPTTGPDGRFEALLPPGTDYTVGLYIPPRSFTNAEFRARPGVVFELGDLRQGTELGIDKTEKMIVNATVNSKTTTAR